ncbi:uncharacterized protein VTP21DRAFT_5446 [Calcarisporiella thermophila]|uniref:uncharacterized protein n=1 Tax=Calcarisporiella thermophila TaxID=911321 RepID=UPI003743B0C0
MNFIHPCQELVSLVAEFEFVSDVDEEMFILYTDDPSQWNRNRSVDQHKNVLEIQIDSHRLEITQNVSVHRSSREVCTGTVVWDSSVCLAQFICSNKTQLGFDPKTTRALELGCGCGVLGTVIAPLVRHITMTDVFDVLRYTTLKNLRRSLPESWISLGEENKTLEEEARVQVQELIWGEPLGEDLFARPYNFIFASDVIYNESIVAAFVSTLYTLLANGERNSVGVLAQELRSDTVHYELLIQLRKHNLAAARVPQKKLPPLFQHGFVIYFIWVSTP